MKIKRRMCPVFQTISKSPVLQATAHHICSDIRPEQLPTCPMLVGRHWNSRRRSRGNQTCDRGCRAQGPADALLVTGGQTVRVGLNWSEAKSDDQGRFRFSNLPDGGWQLSDRDGLQWKSPDKSHNFSSDGQSSIEIHASLPGWSKLKLAPGGND